MSNRQYGRWSGWWVPGFYLGMFASMIGVAIIVTRRIRTLFRS